MIMQHGAKLEDFSLSATEVNLSLKKKKKQLNHMTQHGYVWFT